MTVRFNSDTSDQELLRFALGEPDSDQSRQAASELLGRYRGRVYTWCLRYVRDHEQALDMAQEVLISAYRNLAAFGGRSRFSTWLYTITRNRCLSELRRPSLVLDESVELDSQVSHQATPDRALEERLDEEEVLGLITYQLESVEQEALWLRCLDKMPVEMITELLEIEHVSGARTILQRARRKLRAALADRRDRDEGVSRA